MSQLIDSSTKKIEGYLITIFFFPTFWGYFGSEGISKGQIIYVIITMSIGLIILRPHKLRIPYIFLSLYTLLLISFTITLTFTSLTINNYINWGDFSDLYRPLAYVLSLSIGYSLFSHNTNLSKLIKFLLYTIILCSFFDIIKLIAGTRPILNLYTHLEGLNFMRFAGTFCYCYNYVYILLFGLLLSSFCAKNKFIYLLIFTILIVLAGSRTGFIAYIICIIGYNFLSKGFPKAIISSISIILFTSLIILFIYFLKIPLVEDIFANVEKLYNAIFAGGEDGSMGTRNNQLNRVINNFLTNPLFGIGPQKGTEKPIEIQLGYYLSSWGAIGTTIFIIIILSFLIISWKTKKTPGIYGSFSKANFIWILSSFIMGMSTPITDQIRVFQIFFLIQGIQLSIFVINQDKLLAKIKYLFLPIKFR